MPVATHILNKLIIDKPQTWVNPSFLTSQQNSLDINKHFNVSRVDEKIDNRLAFIRRRICVLYLEGCENHPSLLRLMDFLFATFKSICFDHIPIKFSFIFCNKNAAGKIELSGKVKTSFFFVSYDYMSRIFIFPLTLFKKKKKKKICLESW